MGGRVLLFSVFPQSSPARDVQHRFLFFSHGAIYAACLTKGLFNQFRVLQISSNWGTVCVDVTSGSCSFKGHFETRQRCLCLSLARPIQQHEVALFIPLSTRFLSPVVRSDIVLFS